MMTRQRIELQDTEPTAPQRRKRYVLAALLTLAVASVMPMAGAVAEVLQISATGFALRCPCAATPPGNNEFGEESAGLLLNAKGTYFAPVVFATATRVCRFSLIYRDNDSDINVSARLVRKAFAVGGNAFSAPTVLAQVASAGASSAVRSATTTAITVPVVTLTQSFYFVELTIPGSTLEVLGVQIEHKTTCP